MIALNNYWIVSAQKLPLSHKIETTAARLQIQLENKDFTSILPDPWTLPLDEVLSRPLSGQRPTNQLKPGAE